MQKLTRGAALALCVAVALIGLGSPVSAKPRYDHRSYLAVGDSITVGLGTTDPATKSYPERADIRSVGVGGACWSAECWTADLSFVNALLPKIEALRNRPRTLVFHLGVNDLTIGIPYDTLIKTVDAIRAHLWDSGYRVVLGTVVPAGPHHPASTRVAANGQTIQWNRLRFNEWVRTTGDYVEYAKPLQCAQYLCPIYFSARYGGDGHVNNKGARVMARQLRSFVARDAR